jgi:AFG3 family protein
VSFPNDREAFNKPYSNETAQLIDLEVRTFIDAAYQRTLKLLTEKRDLVDAMAQVWVVPRCSSLAATLPAQ